MADIILRGIEAPIVGKIAGLHGKEAVEEVINQLLGKKMSKLYHSKKWLELQRRKGLTIAQIAEQCDVSYQMIDIYLKKFGVK